MEYIEKCNNSRTDTLIESYLAANDGFLTEKNIYDNFRTPEKPSLIDQILLPEQGNRCCYCMRRMDNHEDSATIEHIIPENATDPAEADHYFQGRPTGLNSRNVCLTHDYFNAGQPPRPPYPHKLAYHNMVIACKDCNNNRGSERIDPLFLYDTVHQEVHYDHQTGKMDWTADPEPNRTVSAVKLNREQLRAFRVAWFYAHAKAVSPQSLNDIGRKDFVHEVFGEAVMNDEKLGDVILNMNGEEFWRRFLKYEYFNQ